MSEVSSQLGDSKAYILLIASSAYCLPRSGEFWFPVAQKCGKRDLDEVGLPCSASGRSELGSLGMG